MRASRRRRTPERDILCAADSPSAHLSVGTESAIGLVLASWSRLRCVINLIPNDRRGSCRSVFRGAGCEPAAAEAQPGRAGSRPQEGGEGAGGTWGVLTSWARAGLLAQGPRRPDQQVPQSGLASMKRQFSGHERVFGTGHALVASYELLIVVIRSSQVHRDGKPETGHGVADYLRRITLRIPWSTAAAAFRRAALSIKWPVARLLRSATQAFVGVVLLGGHDWGEGTASWSSL
jgi:hypothetical protein